jgi:hypothetical protein
MSVSQLGTKVSVMYPERRNNNMNYEPRTRETVLQRLLRHS